MRMLVLLLLLVPLAFAGWAEIAGLALVVATGFLAVAFMLGMAFGVNELQVLAKEEMFQVLASGIMLAALVGTDGAVNSISGAMAVEPGTTNMQDAAIALLTATQTSTAGALKTIGELDMLVNREASKAGNCNIVQVGYGLSGCGGYSMLPTPLSMAGGMVGFAVGELAAMNRLITISKQFALVLLLPLGIILRAFKVTRGAGGFLIALAVSLHLAVPAGVIFGHMLSVSFMASTASSAYRGSTASPESIIPDCEPLDSDASPKRSFSCSGISKSGKNDEKAAYAYCKMREDIRKYTNLVFIKATLGPVIALLMFAASLRAITSLAGAEVDVSAISRFV